MGQYKRKENGITLISLVITVIILLILASVAMSLITGQNGLFARANYAGFVYNRVAQEEKDKYDTLYGYLTQYGGEVISTVSQVTDTNPGDITKDASGATVMGTQNSPYLICSIEDLVAFSDVVNAGEILSTDTYVMLFDSLDFKSTKSYVDSTRTSLTTYSLNGNELQTHNYSSNILTSLTTGAGWEAIGLLNEEVFLGTFNGNEKKLQNLYINYIETTNSWVNCGLFAANGGVIQNIEVSGNLTGTMSTTYEDSGDSDMVLYIATIAGFNYGIIDNCISNATVTGIEAGGYGIEIYSAGISAYNSGDITNCKNLGNISSKSNIQTYLSTMFTSAGIVAQSDGGNIERCCNKGNISTNNAYSEFIGGIVGGSFGTTDINKCYNTGTLSASNVVQEAVIGGIVAHNYGAITNCYNIGSISTSSANAVVKGGIIAIELSMENVTNNYDGSNIGAIGGQNFIGKAENATLTENQILNYINNNTHPTSAIPSYAIDNRLTPGVYVSYDTSGLGDEELSTSLTGYYLPQYAYPSNYSGKWQVLSNNGTTVELISSDLVNAGDSGNRSTTDFHLSGENGYKNVVNALNTVAGAYLNSNLAVSARCVGSSSSSVGSVTASLQYKPTDYSQLNDLEYYKDVANMLYSGTLTINKIFWLPSRIFWCVPEIGYFRLRLVVFSSYGFNLAEQVIGEVEQNGNVNAPHSSMIKQGVRPVVTLRNDLEIKSGNGISESPYVLGAK